MFFTKRGGPLLVLCGLVSFMLFGCQTPKPAEPPEEAEESSIAGEEEPNAAEATGEIVPSGPELKELEESLVPEPRSRDRKRGLAAQAKRHGFALHRDPQKKQWLLERGTRSLILKEDSRIAVYDGITVYLDSPLSRDRGVWTLSESDERIVLSPTSSLDRKSTTIVIDPGHGGSEDGAKNEPLHLLEKDLNLDVALRLKEHLEKQGFKTVLTRYDDRKVPLEKRAEIANSAKASLFLSIHFNSAANTKANGLETYVLTPEGAPSTSSSEVGDDAIAYPGNRFDKENFELAYRIQKSMLSGLNREDRGVKKARFLVLKGLECPGVLVECGFVSNREESLLLSTPGYRERLAQSLSVAIGEYASPDS